MDPAFRRGHILWRKRVKTLKNITKSFHWRYALMVDKITKTERCLGIWSDFYRQVSTLDRNEASATSIVDVVIVVNVVVDSESSVIVYIELTPRLEQLAQLSYKQTQWASQTNEFQTLTNLKELGFLSIAVNTRYATNFFIEQFSQLTTFVGNNSLYRHSPKL